MVVPVSINQREFVLQSSAVSLDVVVGSSFSVNGCVSLDGSCGRGFRRSHDRQPMTASHGWRQRVRRYGETHWPEIAAGVPPSCANSTRSSSSGSGLASVAVPAAAQLRRNSRQAEKG